MSAFSFLLNLLWILFGGLWMAFGWVIAAIFMAITIIGLPWSRAAFNIAAYTLLPFGQKVVSRAIYSGREDIGAGPLGVVGNLAWLVLTPGLGVTVRRPALRSCGRDARSNGREQAPRP